MAFQKICGICSGRGYSGYDSADLCRVCKGTGGILVDAEEREFRACGPCGGTGQTGYAGEVCSVCRGLGLIRPHVWIASVTEGTPAQLVRIAGNEHPVESSRGRSLTITLPRACASAVRAVVVHLRTELALADNEQALRDATQHFDRAAMQALEGKRPIDLHKDGSVNGWLLFGARSLLAASRTHHSRLQEIVGLLLQAGAIAPRGNVGTSFGRLRRIGAGSYGEVWHVVRTDSTMSVAVKQCHAKDGKLPDERSVEALRKEAMCLMRMSHQAIPKFVSCDFDRPDPYLAMQYVDGVRLGDWLLGQPDAAQREQVLRALLDALDHAHGLDIYHRDLKAENILVASGSRPFIIDWGGAKTLLPEQQTAMPRFLANIRNSAPECILHVRSRATTPFPYGAAQDMWSLGVIAYHVLTDKHPFEVPLDPLYTIEDVLRLEPVPLPPECGVWTGLVADLLQKDPERRLGCCADILRTLERVANLDSILEGALQELGKRMVDSDEVLVGEMAGTNATGFGCDDHHILEARYDYEQEAIYFEAHLHFSGDQLEDKMWCGDAFSVRVQGRAIPQDDEWAVDDYRVLECADDYFADEDDRT